MALSVLYTKLVGMFLLPMPLCIFGLSYQKLGEKNSVEFCTQLVQKTGVAVAPGAGFGKSGEGYVRFALVHDVPVLQTAVQRISHFL